MKSQTRLSAGSLDFQNLNPVKCMKTSFSGQKDVASQVLIQNLETGSGCREKGHILPYLLKKSSTFYSNMKGHHPTNGLPKLGPASRGLLNCSINVCNCPFMAQLSAKKTQHKRDVTHLSRFFWSPIFIQG